MNTCMYFAWEIVLWCIFEFMSSTKHHRCNTLLLPGASLSLKHSLSVECNNKILNIPVKTGLRKGVGTTFSDFPSLGQQECTFIY